MVLDSSAIISVLLGEPDEQIFIDAMNMAPSLWMAAPTWVEAAMVITGRKGQAGFQEFEKLLATLDVKIVEFDKVLGILAYDAYLMFGKGKHPAALNMGDCFSYALAKHRSDTLLFKGNDFSKTDLVPAV